MSGIHHVLLLDVVGDLSRGSSSGAADITLNSVIATSWQDRKETSFFLSKHTHPVAESNNFYFKFLTHCIIFILLPHQMTHSNYAVGGASCSN